MATLVARAALLACHLGCSGIRIEGPGGEVHHVIIGFGIVSYSQSCDAMIMASRSHSLGVDISDRGGPGARVGLSSSLVVTVAEGAEDVRAEVSILPGGSMIVDAPSATGAPVQNPNDEKHLQGSKRCRENVE